VIPYAASKPRIRIQAHLEYRTHEIHLFFSIFIAVQLPASNTRRGWQVKLLANSIASAHSYYVVAGFEQNGGSIESSGHRRPVGFPAIPNERHRSRETCSFRVEDPAQKDGALRGKSPAHRG